MGNPDSIGNIAQSHAQSYFLSNERATPVLLFINFQTAIKWPLFYILRSYFWLFGIFVVY